MGEIPFDVVFVVGPPGAGKGTQCRLLAPSIGAGIVSVSGLLRNSASSDRTVAHKVDVGLLQPELATQLVLAELRLLVGRAPVLVDGMFRDIAEVAVLSELETLTQRIRVLDLVVQDAVCLQRMRRRRVCTVCNASFRGGEFCEECGGLAVTRSDDRGRMPSARLQAYREAEVTILTELALHTTVTRVNGEGPARIVSRRIGESLIPDSGYR